MNIFLGGLAFGWGFVESVWKRAKVLRFMLWVLSLPFMAALALVAITLLLLAALIAAPICALIEAWKEFP